MYKNNFLNGNDAQKLLFKTYLKKLTKVKRLSKKMYFYLEFDKNKNNCHKMWITINSLLHKKSVEGNSPPNVTKIDGKICDNHLAMAERFYYFFVQLANVWLEKWEITAVKA